MSFASFVTKLGDALNDGIRTAANSPFLANTVGKATRAGLNVGKAAGNAAIKVGANTLKGGFEAGSYLIDHGDEIKAGAKAFGVGVTKEANEWAQAGIGGLGKIIDTFTTDANWDRSIIGKKFNKKGLAAVGLIATGMQGSRDVKQYIDSRQGQNDGQIYRPTPQISTPYQLSQQMAYSSHGRSFADNAGATGDLVFALNNMRNG